MKIDLSKLNQIVIQDKDRNVVDRITPSSITLEKTKLFGNTLFIQKQ